MKTLINILRRLYYFRIYRNLNSCGKNVRLSYGGLISKPSELSIGSNVFIGNGFHISPFQMVIGNNVMIGPNFVVECDDHSFNKIGKPMFEYRSDKKYSPVIIQNDVWIGANVVILKGVRISEGSIIGAGSIVTKNIPPYTIAVGCPCKPIKQRFMKEDLKKHLNLIKSEISAQDVISEWTTHDLNIQ